jgi:hypothetical protein
MAKYKKLLKKIESEHKVSKDFLNDKKKEWHRRLKLYNNQRREATKIGDPLLFKTFNTVFAALYDDRLITEFVGREEGDHEKAQNLSLLAEYDYELMEKARWDYEWIWDAMFYGRGFLLVQEWNAEQNHPVPEVIDPMVFFHDPRATRENGRGGLRFFGRLVEMTKLQMEKNGNYENLDKLKDSPHNDLEEAHEARADAQDHQYTNKRVEGDNRLHTLLEWFTFEKGERKFYTTDLNFKTIYREQDIETPYWGLVGRQIYPITHDYWGVSVPDLVEDKQRARAKLANLSLTSVESALYPMYLVDTDRIKNISSVGEFGFNKIIPTDGDAKGAIAQVERKIVNQDAQWIMQEINMNAQDATATPEIAQGAISRAKRSATEVSGAMKRVDTRYALSAKIFGWSEQEFWRQWFNMYKVYFDEKIGEKIMRLTSPLGYEWKPIQKDDIDLNYDPDIKIQSKEVSEAKRMNNLQIYSNLLMQLAQNPQVNLRFAHKKLAQLSGLKSDEVNYLLPKSIEELEADLENKDLSKDVQVDVHADDDHIAHILEHAKASQTNSKKAHIETHIAFMQKLKENPEMMRQLQERQKQSQNGDQDGGLNPQVGNAAQGRARYNPSSYNANQ